MDRGNLYEAELKKLEEIFEGVDPIKTKLTEGLRQQAAFLYAENAMLEHSMKETGTVKIHPEFPELQKPIESAKQYRQNANTYAVVIKTLNGILSKDGIEQDDDFKKFLKEMHGLD